MKPTPCKHPYLECTNCGETVKPSPSPEAHCLKCRASNFEGKCDCNCHSPEARVDWEDSKKCSTCGKVKPREMFFKNKIRRDGHLNICKECYRLIDAKRYYTHREKRLLKDKIRHKKTYSTEKARLSYHKRDKEKSAARAIFRNAVRNGDLVKQPCFVCGSKKSEGHHEDYSKPLVVLWLCKTHHMQRHRGKYAGLPEAIQAAFEKVREAR
jgi:hypothetical protein